MEMQDWMDLNSKIRKASEQHDKLAAEFGKFALLAHKLSLSEHHSNKKIIIDCSSLKQGFFTAAFGGRTLVLAFKSVLDDREYLVGQVTCYQKLDLPESKHLKIGSFCFDQQGETSLIDTEENEHIYLESNMGPIYIVLQFIYESLAAEVDE